MLRTVLLNSPYTYYDDIDFSALQNDFISIDGVVKKTDNFDDFKVEIDNGKLKIRQGVLYMKVIVDGFFKENPDGSVEKVNYPSIRSLVIRVENNEDILIDLPSNDGTYKVVVFFDKDIPNNELGSNTCSIQIKNVGDDLTNCYVLATLSINNGTPLIQDERNVVTFRSMYFDLNNGHTHNGIDSAKIDSENIIFDKTGTDLNGDNVENIIKELNIKKSNVGHTHHLSDIVDVSVTATELNRNLPSNDEKDALSGAGIPSASNPYATKDYVDSAINSGLNETAFNNIFKKDDKVYYVGDVKKGKIDELIYENTNYVVGTENFLTFLDTFDEYFVNVIKLYDVVDSENWQNGSFDNTNYIYQKSRKLTLGTDATGTLFLDTTLNISFDDFDLYFTVYIGNKNNVDEVNLQLKTDNSNYFEIDLLNKVNTGWNLIKVNKNDFTKIGNPDWNNIATIRWEFSTNTSGGSDFNIDFSRAAIVNWTEGVWTTNNVSVLDFSGDKLCLISKVGEAELGLIPINQGRTYKNLVLKATYDFKFSNEEIGFILRKTINGYILVKISNTTLYVEENNGSNTNILLNEAITFDNNVEINLKEENLEIKLGDSSYTTTTSILDEGELVIKGLGDGVIEFDNIQVYKSNPTFTKSDDDKLVRVNNVSGYAEKFEFPKNRYILVKGSDLGYGNEVEGFLGGACLINNTGQNTYSKQGEFDLITYKYYLIGQDNDTFNIFYNLSNDVNDLKLLFKTDDNNYFEILLNKTAGNQQVTIQRGNVTKTGNPDWSNITSIDLYVDGDVDIVFEGIEIMTAIHPLSEIYNVSGELYFGEKDDKNYVVGLGNFTPSNDDFVIKDGEIYFDVLNPNVSFEFRKQDNGACYFIEVLSDRIQFGKKDLNGSITYIGDSSFVNNPEKLYIKLQLENNVIKYYYSIDGETYILVDEIVDTSYNEGKFNIILNGGAISEYYVKNVLSGADLYTIMLYEGDELVGVIERP